MPIKVDVPRAIIEEVLRIGRCRPGGTRVNESRVEECLDHRFCTVVTEADPPRLARDKCGERTTRSQRCELNREAAECVRSIAGHLSELGQQLVLFGCERFV